MKKWKIISMILLGIIVILFALYYFIFRLERVTYYGGGYDATSYGADCVIAGVNLHGTLLTYLSNNEYDDDYASAEDIYAGLTSAEDTSRIKAVILEIDSYGGIPVAAEELANKISSMKKPVIAMIRGAGASGAYWIASATDRIFASELSDIGSIGVTMSYLDQSKSNASDGYTWNSLSTGPFKDSGDPNKPLTYAERVIFERDLKLTFEKFIKTVADNRGLSIDKVRSLADGSTMMGKQALENGLIDEIGFLPEVEKYLKDKYNIEGKVCW